MRGRPLRILLAAVATCALPAARLGAQDAGGPSFEVVSIRPQKSGNPAYIPTTPMRFVDVNATLRSLVTWAWNVRGFQVDGGPDWAGSQRFDVSATTVRRCRRQRCA
jgi:uncharacterized protein (TIGR03435 family)